MKKKISVFLIFFFLQISSQAKSELTERQIYTELFVGCVEEGDEYFSLGAQFEYCACIISSMSWDFTYDELMFFAEGKESLSINEKLGKFAENCIEKVYQ